MMIDFDYFEPAAIKYRELKAQERLTIGVQVYIPLHKQLSKPSRGMLIAIHQGEPFPYEVDFGTSRHSEWFAWYQLEVVAFPPKEE